MRQLVRMLAALLVGTGGAAGGLFLDTGHAAAQAAPPAPIAIVTASPLPGGVTCGVALFCFTPAKSEAVAGTPITWKNTTSLPQSAASDDNTTFNTGPIPPGQVSKPIVLPAGTYAYHDGAQPTSIGSLTVTPAPPPPPPGPGQPGGPPITVQHQATVSLAHPTSISPLGSDTILQGSHALPPVTGGDTASQDLPPVTTATPAPAPRTRELASAAEDGGSRAPLYIIAGLVFLLALAIGSSLGALRWWRHHERRALGA